MKKIVSILLVLFLMISITACGESNNSKNAGAVETTEQEDSAIAKIQDKGELVLATSADYPPFEWHMIQDGEDKIVGFEIAIAQKFADELGVDLVVRDMKFEGLLPALASGDANIATGGLAVTEERKQSVDFSDVYYKTPQVLLVRTEDALSFNAISDLDGKLIGAQLGATQEALAKEVFPNSEHFSMMDLNGLVQEVKNSKIDALLTVGPVGEQFAALNPELEVVDVGIPAHDGAAIGIGKGQEDLVQFINEKLILWQEDGTIDTLVEEYNALAAEDARANQ